MTNIIAKEENIDIMLTGCQITFILLITIIIILSQKCLQKSKKANSVSNIKDTFIYNKECPICYNLLHIPVRSECGHAYCIDCLYMFWKKANWKNRCPLCRAPLKNLQLLENEGSEYSDLTRKKLMKKIDSISDNSIFSNLALMPILSYTIGLFVVILWTSAILNIDSLLQYSVWIYNSYYSTKNEIHTQS